MTKSIKNVLGLVAVTVLASFAMSASAASTYVHARTLTVGSRGLAVESLQEALNACWDLGLVADGIFGNRTKAAVMAAQLQAGVGVDGIVGPITGAAVSNCDASDSSSNGGNTSNNGNDSFVAGGGPELRTRNFQIRNATYSSVEEGSRGVEVARVSFDTQYSDAKLERVDLVATPNGSVPSPTTPWRVFDRMMVKVNGVTVATVDSSNATMWDEISTGVYRLRISAGLSEVLKKDMTQNISIAADINSGANGTASSDVKWDISLGADAQGIRLLDQAGITQYVGLASVVSGTLGTNATATNAATVTIKNIGGLSTVSVTASSNDPVSKTLMANKTTSSSQMLVHSYTIKAENGDIKIKTLPVTLTFTEASGGTGGSTSASGHGAVYTALVDSTWVEINGQKFDTITSKSSTDSNPGEVDVINFDINRNVTIASGSSATVNVYVRLNALPDSGGNANADSGATLKSSLTGTALTLETGMYDVVPSGSITGSATGYVHTVRTSGVVATMGTASVSKTVDTNGKVTSVTYSVPVTMTASGNTFYIAQAPEWAATSSAGDTSSAKALAFTLQSATAPTTDITAVANSTFTNGGTTTGSVISTLSSSNASIQNLGFRLDDGSAKNFTLTVTATTGTGAGNTTDSLRVALKSVKFYSADTLADAAGETIFTLLPVENYRTGFETLVR